MATSVSVLLCYFLATALCSYVEINTLSGRIQGIQQKTDPKGNIYYAFKGIPYAEPPERFKLSVPVKPWKGIYNATTDGPICMQIIPTSKNESEDCLFVNVYTPKLPETVKIEPLNNKPSATPNDYDDYYDTFTDEYISKDQIFDNTVESDFVASNEKSKTVIDKDDTEGFDNYDEDEVDVDDESVRSKSYEEEDTNKSRSVNKKRAVMVWIHGGAFTSGDSTYETYGPDYFLDDGVVFVSMNYRLGAFGFLSTGDSRLPANLGMKDIILALQWIKKNIEYFGGDPNRITIFGESAGAVLVTHLVQSPLTKNKGYFHRAIAQSGNSLVPWAIQRYPKKLYDSMVIASGCVFWFIGGPNKVLDCLRTTNAQVLRFASTAVFGVTAGFQVEIINSMSFSLVMEKPSETAAIVKGSYEYLSTEELPNIPILMGTNSEESIALNTFIGFIKPFFLQIDMNPVLLVPDDMNAPKKIIQELIAPKLFDYYYNRKTVTHSSDESILRFVSGNFFNRAFRHYFTLIGNRVPTYCYKLSYQGKMGGIHTFFDGLERVGHADDLSYLFRNNDSKKLDFPVQDFITRYRMVRMWTNFAKSGNPTPVSDDLLKNTTWPRAFIKDSNINCLDIRSELKVIKNPYQDEYMMWKKLYDKYGKPNDTY